MAEQQTALSTKVDLGFLTSKRALLKISQIVVVFVSFVCFAADGRAPYIAVMCVEFFITLALLLLYLLKLHKTLTFFFWPLIDMSNSITAAVFVFVVSVIALSTYTATGSLVGGVGGLVAAVLWGADGYYIFTKITFNRPTAAEHN